MKDLLLLFGVALAKRYTYRQKKFFFEQVKPFFSKLGYKVTLRENKQKLIRISNIFIGDIHKARYVILCPYDTPSRSLLPYKYYPFNLSENLHQERIELFLRSLIYIGSCLCAYFTFKHFLMFHIVVKVLSILFFIGIIYFCYRLITGIPNPVNFNRNSASVALIAALVGRVKYQSNTAFVFLDNTISSNAGLRFFAEDEILKNKVFIYLDCIAYGEEFVCAHNRNTNSEAEKLVSFLKGMDVIDKGFPEEQLKGTNLDLFPKLLHLCAGAIEDHYFVVRNTRSKKDFKVDVPRLEILCTGLANYLGGY
jgi:hypothetical protein